MERGGEERKRTEEREEGGKERREEKGDNGRTNTLFLHKQRASTAIGHSPPR